MEIENLFDFGKQFRFGFKKITCFVFVKPTHNSEGRTHKYCKMVLIVEDINFMCVTTITKKILWEIVRFHFPKEDKLVSKIMVEYLSYNKKRKNILRY